MSNTGLTVDEGFMVFVAGTSLASTDYTLSNKTASSTITFINAIWNDQPIKVIYFTAPGPTSNAFEGSIATGSDGDSGRTVSLDNTNLTLQSGFQVYVDGVTLVLTTDYTVVHNPSGSVVTFVNALWDSSNISIIYYLTTGVYTNNPTEADFYGGPIKDFGRLLTLTRVTTTVSNITGEKTMTDGTELNIIGVFQRKSPVYSLMKEGLRQDVDAVAYIDKDQEIARNDKITVNGFTYRVENYLVHFYDGNGIMQEVGLYQIT